jgi:hypothetical protein
MPQPPRTPAPRLHLSVDDVAVCLRDLTERPSPDPWRHPTFASLRALHEGAGVVVSLYLFERADGWRLGQMPADYRAAFAAAAGWLRFAFHGRDAGRDYGSGGVSLADAAEDYRRVVREVRRFAGAASIDRMPRVHRFRGRVDVVRAWRDERDGVRGLLCADDDRPEVYHLDAAARDALRRDGAAFDGRERLHLAASLTRLEGAFGDVARRLDEAAATPAARAGVPICLFTHEQHLAAGVVQGRIAAVLRWAQLRGAGFAFPLDVLDAQAPESRSCS